MYKFITADFGRLASSRKKTILHVLAEETCNWEASYKGSDPSSRSLLLSVSPFPPYIIHFNVTGFRGSPLCFIIANPWNMLSLRETSVIFLLHIMTLTADL